MESIIHAPLNHESDQSDKTKVLKYCLQNSSSHSPQILHSIGSSQNLLWHYEQIYKINDHLYYHQGDTTQNLTLRLKLPEGRSILLCLTFLLQHG